MEESVKKYSDVCEMCGLSSLDCCCYRLTCPLCGYDDLRDIGDGLFQCMGCDEVSSEEEIKDGRRF